MGTDSAVRRGQQVILAGLFSNVVLAALQITAGWYGQSRAVLADGFHSTSDILISLVVLASLAIAHRPADASHPYGYGKAESIATFLVGLVIAVAGLGLVYDAVGAIAGGVRTVPGILPLVVAPVSIAVKGMLYGVTIRIGRRLDSPAVLAAAQEYRSCVACSSSALVGIICAHMGLPVADSIAAFLVAGFVLKVGGELLWDSVRDLTDAALPREYVDSVRSAATVVPGVKDVPQVRTRRIGSRRFVEVEVSTEPDLMVEEADRVAAEVEQQVSQQVRNTDSVRVFISSAVQEPHLRSAMEAAVRRIILRHASRFVSFSNLQISRLDRDLCSHFTVVLPPGERMDRAYRLCADLEQEIKSEYPTVEVIIRLQTTPQDPGSAGHEN